MGASAVDVGARMSEPKERDYEREVFEAALTWWRSLAPDSWGNARHAKYPTENMALLKVNTKEALALARACGALYGDPAKEER